MNYNKTIQRQYTKDLLDKRRSKESTDYKFMANFGLSLTALYVVLSIAAHIA